MRRVKGFSLVEVLFAVFFLSLFLGGTVFLTAENASTLVGTSDRLQALQLAREGLEASASIRTENWCALAAGTYGLSSASGSWLFSGTSDTIGKFTRSVTVEDVRRDANGAVVSPPNGSPDGGSKKITVTVSWSDLSGSQQQTTIAAFLTYWQSKRNGMLVYADGGTSSDTLRYRILNGTTDSWETVQALPDVDPSTTNRVARGIELYSSPYRDEKIVITKHFNGSVQSIYAQVHGGCTGWGNLVQLASYNLTSFVDLHNFSGAYLANGDFMVVYSDNTSLPKFRVWDGSSWSGQIAMVDLSQNRSANPGILVAKARPGTNEVMAVFFGQARDTNTQYFNGGAYETASWTLHPRHANNAPANTKKFIDFSWSKTTPTKGALVFSTSGNDRQMHINIWTANGTGSGTWGNTVNTSNQQNAIGALTIKARPTAGEFIACNKDAKNPPRIICYLSTITPAWSNPTNQILTTASDSGTQISFDVGFENETGLEAIAVYSDNTATPKLKKYNATSPAWDSSPGSLPALSSTIETAVMVPQPNTNDIMVLVADTNQELVSLVWNGDTNLFYGSPAGYAYTAQGTNGSNDLDQWFDFAWDQF